MKPHEETWYYDDALGEVFLQIGIAPSDDDDPLDAEAPCFVNASPAFVARQVLRAAAPQMARALLTVLNESSARLEGKTWKEIRAALTAAGVPVP